MKYEKFEEWMVGKKFYNVHDHNDFGVIIGKRDEETVNVIYENDGPARGPGFCNVVFVDSPEEEPSKEGGVRKDSQIDWQVGQVVWDVRYGKGIVDTLLAIPGQYPIGVVFTDGSTASYTSNGLNRCTDVYRSLFFSEPVVTAELFPPKKHFVPTLKKGDKVVLTDSVADYVAEVVREEENHIYYKTEDGVVTFVDKNLVKVFKLGEEIKFQ